MKFIATKPVKILFLCFLISMCFICTPANSTESNDFKVIGYYTATSFDEPLERLQLDKLTHIMYGFLIPTENGEILPIPQENKLKELVELAHEKNVKVFAAVGGWSYNNTRLEPTFVKLAKDTEKRTKFVESVASIAKKYNLDGIELDWEYPNALTGVYYNQTVIELADALHSQDKQLSLAVAGAASIYDRPETSRMISQKSLNTVDFIEIMSYDLKATQHSPMWFAMTSLSYWQLQGASKDKLVLGMPLFAMPSWLQYRHIVEANIDYAYEDFLPAGTISKLSSGYNGLLTLHDKTVLALDKAGGVMLFDINEDRDDEYSVLSLIDELAKDKKESDEATFNSKVWININKRPLVFNNDGSEGSAFIDKNGRTLIPLRKCVEAISCDVEYLADTRQVIIKNDNHKILITIGSNIINIDGKDKAMDTEAVIINNRTHIPARVIFEALGYSVEWHQYGRSVYIQN